MLSFEKEFFNTFEKLATLDSINFVYKPHTRGHLAGIEEKMLSGFNAFGRSGRSVDPTRMGPVARFLCRWRDLAEFCPCRPSQFWRILLHFSGF